MEAIDCLLREFAEKQARREFTLAELEIFLRDRETSLENIDLFDGLRCLEQLGLRPEKGETPFLPPPLQGMTHRAEIETASLTRGQQASILLFGLLVFLAGLSAGATLWSHRNDPTRFETLRCRNHRAKIALRINRFQLEDLKPLSREFDPLVAGRAPPGIASDLLALSCPAGGKLSLAGYQQSRVRVLTEGGKPRRIDVPFFPNVICDRHKESSGSLFDE